MFKGCLNILTMWSSNFGKTPLVFAPRKDIKWEERPQFYLLTKAVLQELSFDVVNLLSSNESQFN